MSECEEGGWGGEGVERKGVVWCGSSYLIAESEDC